MSSNNTTQIIKKFSQMILKVPTESAVAVFLNSELSLFTNLSAMSSIFTAELAAVARITFNIHKTNYKSHILLSIVN